MLVKGRRVAFSNWQSESRARADGLKSHKKQHWIPAAAYLKAWADPDSPEGQTPFVHVFSRDGSQRRRRAPDNIFHETDLYTIDTPDGGRDLRLEHGLAGLETAFWNMRRDFLDKRKTLPVARHVKLMAFVAAMHARTPMMRDHHAEFWNSVQRIGEETETQMRNKSIEERKRIAGYFLPSKGRSMSLDDVRKITANPMQHTLPGFLKAELPLLLKMRCVVLCTQNDPGFITSDNPVVWHDPDAYKRPPLMRSPAFMNPKLQITLPLSPTQTLMLVHGQPSFEYVDDVADVFVQETNRLTRFHAHKEFVVRRDIVDPYWLEAGEMPPDAWEYSQEARDLEA